MAYGRKFRNVVILAKIETTKGTDAVPTGAANAMLPVGEVSMTPIDAERVQRAVIRGFFGAPDSLLGSSWMSLRFSIEAQGSGAAGTAPAWGALLRACGFAETVTAATRVDYTPVSTALEGVSIYAYADGAEHKFIGAVGTVNVSMGVGGIPLLNFEFVAPYVAPSAVSNPTPTLTNWKVPLLVNDANTSDLVLGGAYSAGAISGGTPYVSGGLEFDLANQISRRELIGAKDVVIADRNVTGTIKTLDLTVAQEIALHALITGNTPTSIGMVHGTQAGYKVLMFFTAAKLLNINPVNLEGVWTSDVPFEAPPSAGNDDMRIVAL